MLELKSFNLEGITRTRKLIDGLTLEMKKGSKGIPVTDSDLAHIVSLAHDKSLMEPIKRNVEIDETKEFDSSYSLGDYLTSQMKGTAIGEESAGIWTWLSCIYIRNLLAKNSNGEILLGKSYRYVFEPEDRLRYYRHLIFMPCYLYRKLGRKSYLFLFSPAYQSGEFLAQAQKADFIANPNLVDMCEKYYFDRAKQRFSPGFTSTSAKEPRSLRRLVQAIVPQLSINYDLMFCSSEQIFELLPEDFQSYSIE